MELDVNILRDMLTERGFYPGNRGNEHVWKNVINGIPYAVDFRIGAYSAICTDREKRT